MERVYAFSKELQLDYAVLLTTPDLKTHLPDFWRRVDLKKWSTDDLLTAMSDAATEAERILYISGDEPLLLLSVTERMLALQREYRTEYTFADGYPEGVTPEIVVPAVLPILKKLNDDRPEKLGRDILFRLIQRDINAFDLETEIAPVDLRLLRASITCDNRRNFLLAKALIEGKIADEEGILRELPEREELLRTLPAYFNVQVTNSYSQRVSYEPFFDLQKEETPLIMEAERFEALLQKIEEYAPDSVVSIGYRGEPALHPRIIDLIEAAESSPSVSLYIETSGVGWSPDSLARLTEIGLGSTTIIVLLDAVQKEAYSRLRGDGFEEAIAFARTMRKVHPERCYVQATRLSNEQETLEEFYVAWKDDNPVIQKYNHYCGTLADRRVTDLSPLERFPCGHLRRDMTVLLDGTVPICQEDLNGSGSFGNVFSDSLEAVWSAGADLYGAHTRGEYPGICAACDEYYTYNA